MCLKINARIHVFSLLSLNFLLEPSEIILNIWIQYIIWKQNILKVQLILNRK